MLIPLGLLGVFALGLAGWSAYVGRKAEEMVPADGQFAEVVRRLPPLCRPEPRGRRPAIVMIHGLMGQLRNFSHSLAARLAADHRVILVDRPGWGHSLLERVTAGDRRTGGSDRRADRAARTRKPLLVGHSLGGAVSLRWASIGLS